MKKSIAATLLIAGVLSTNAFAITTGETGNNVALITKIVKSENIDKTVERANYLANYIQQYIYLTGDLNVNTDKIKNAFDLSDASISNFNGGKLNVLIDPNTYKIKVTNIFSTPIDNDTLNMLKSSADLSPLANVKDNKIGSNYKPEIDYAMPPKLVQFVNKVKEIKRNPNAEINSNLSEGQRCSIGKTGYKPTGTGDLIVYQCIDNKWKEAGSLLNGSGGIGSETAIVVDSPDKLNQYNSIASVGTKGYVKDGDKLKEYVFDGNSWSEVQTGSSQTEASNAVFNGSTSNLADLIVKLKNVAPGSKVTVNSSDGSTSTYEKKLLVDDPSISYWINNNKVVVMSINNYAKYYNNGDSGINFNKLILVDSNNPFINNIYFGFSSSGYFSGNNYYSDQWGNNSIPPDHTISYFYYNNNVLDTRFNSASVKELINTFIFMKDLQNKLGVPIKIHTSETENSISEGWGFTNGMNFLVNNNALGDSSINYFLHYGNTLEDNAYGSTGGKFLREEIFENFNDLKQALDDDNVPSGKVYLVSDYFNNDKNVSKMSILYIDKVHHDIVCKSNFKNCKNISKEIIIPQK